MFEKSKNRSMDNSKTGVKINFIEPNTKIVGDINSQADFRFDGTLEGTIRTTGRVVIGKEGKITGNVYCTNADVLGHFKGELEATNLLSVKSGGQIEGQITTSKLAVEVGATLNAQCIMKGKSVKSLNATNDQESEKTA